MTVGHALRIGLTGPIGCGKSTVARWLGEEPGVVVVDADEVAREVRQDPEIERRIVERFGTADPASLARVVFTHNAALHDLEEIVHPAVRPRILAALEQADAGGARAVVIEAIKLVEGGLADLCDEVWLVTCGPDVQRVRLVERRTRAEDADLRIAAQGDIADRLAARATRIIDTSGSLDDTQAALSRAWTSAVQAARSI